MTRISLASCFLLLTVVALSVALYKSTADLTDARAELNLLRSELRMLDPSESDKMRAIEVPAFGRNQWRWRVDLPDDDEFVLRWAYDDIPIRDTLPTTIDPDFNPHQFRPPKLPSDEFMLLIAAVEDEGTWKLGVKAESVSQTNDFHFTVEMRSNDSSWLARRGGNTESSDFPPGETAVCPSDVPFVLLRYRKGLAPRPGITAPDPAPTDGILIWIEKSDKSEIETN